VKRHDCQEFAECGRFGVRNRRGVGVRLKAERLKKHLGKRQVQRDTALTDLRGLATATYIHLDSFGPFGIQGLKDVTVNY
jgi:hypothetical protein